MADARSPLSRGEHARPPAHPADGAFALAGARPPRPGPRGTAVLHVSADARARAAARRALEGAGHAVVDAAGPLDAVDAALATEPRVLVIDAARCGGDAREVVRALRALPPLAAVPVVAVVARRSARLRGAADVVVLRGDGPEGLVRGVERALRLRRRRQGASDQAGVGGRVLGRVAARLHDLRREADRTQRLLEAGRVLASTLELSQVLYRLAELVQRQLRTDSVVRIWLRDDETGEFRLHAQAGRMNEKPPERVSSTEGLVGWVSRHRAALVLEDLPGDARVRNQARVREEGLVSFLGVPLLLDGRAVGVLTAATRHRHVFSAEDVEVVEALATSAALAIENARLYSEATRRRREAEELARLARMLTESLDAADVGERIVQSALYLLGGSFSVLRVLDPGGALRLAASGGDEPLCRELVAVMPPGNGVVGRALRQGAPAWSADVLADPRLEYSETVRNELRRLGVRGYLAAPLRVKRETIGVIGIGSTAPRAFSEAEVALLQTFADQAAIALENSRLYGELRGALRAVEESHQRIVRGERLRALGEMAAGVAHDFNNVLAIIVGRAEVVLAESQDPEITRHVNVIVKVALDAAQTVQRIQEFSRMRRGRALERVNLAQVVEEVVEVTRSRWKDEAQARGVHYDVVVEPGRTPPIAGDPAELREALTNIVFNALDAMPGGGRLTLGTAVEGDRVVCTVTDTGAGMTEEVRQRIFDPYFTTKGERGTGLGLSVVYGIVTRHGGEVEVQSEPGHGTRFTLRFPVAGERADEAAERAPRTPVRPARILVVDDEPGVGDVLWDLLARDGHDVVVCADAESALARLAAEPFDLVMTDLGMPGISGWEIARRVAELRPGMPVAMVTGWGDRIDPDEARERGIACVIAKPFRRDRLREALGAVLRPAPGPGGPRP